MGYTVEKGKIISDNGVPYLPRWFCDDLIAFEADGYGISKVEYFNRTTKGSEKVFVDDMWGGIRFYIENSGYHNSQNIKKCEVMPYGFSGEWNYKDIVFEYEQRAVNNCIIVSLKTAAEAKKNLKFVMEFYDSLCLIIRKDGDTRYINKIEREWRQWEFDKTYMKNSYREDEGETHIAIAANVSIEYIKRDIGNVKNILLTEDIGPGKEYIFIISLDETEEKAKRRAKETLENYNELAKMQDERYKKIMQTMPVLESPYKALNDFFVLAPLYHESCKVQSIAGAIRAKTEHYWIWGWDGMSSSFAYAYWGDVEFIEELLKFYRDTADKEAGIAHCFERDMSHRETSMAAAQGFYISLLYQYYMNGGDISAYYEFAKWIFELIANTEVNNTGLCKGYSLVPDFRETILETGNDLSTFNNSSSYCAIRAMVKLAEQAGDTETSKKASDFADRMKESFEKILFDKERGFYAASADADTLEKREAYMSPSIKWDNLYCYDLIKGNKGQILEFFENNFVCECGIMYTPVWDISYDADANQLHCYWPSNGECYSRLINFENRKDLIEQWISWVSCWTDILMCPEGIDCYDNINRPKPDGWNAVNGTWQTYSIRAWYEAAVHSVVGVDFAENGMNIYPYDGEEMTLKNLHYCGRTFDIHMKGSGCDIENVTLNGREIGAVREISMDNFEKHNIIEIIRCNK